MFLTFTSDLSPYLTDSAASRFLIGIIPASRYLIDPDSGTNLTLQAACYHIMQSFNRLSQQGVPVKDVDGSSEARLHIPTLYLD